MSNYYTYKAGIGASGQYIASGRPWIKTNTSVASGATEEYSFPAVTKTITIVSNRDLEMFFSETAPAENKISLLSANSPHTFNLKCREMFLTNTNGSFSASIQVIAGLTGIEDEYVLTGSGITEP
tara:strand:- start:707 stop:1081 length:375 start_codon:yes stop_codon:yes gene_type:complete